MKQVNVQEAKTHLSRLLEEVEAGEEVILARAGKPIARLVPIQAAARPRVGGQLAEQIEEGPGCWEPDADLARIMAEAPLYADSPLPSSRVAED